MTVHNQEIADIFSEIADLLEIDNANPFRVRAYRGAAQLISSYSRSIEKMVADGENLTLLPGIGKDLAEKIAILVKTGTLPQLKQLEKRIPKTVIALLKIPGLGPKKVKTLFQDLQITSFSDLKAAAEAHKIAALRGFSSKTEKAILQEIAKKTGDQSRYLLATVQEIAEELLSYLKKCPGTEQLAIAGSFRRKKETVGDLDILITAPKGKEITDYFVQFPKTAAILAHGSTRATIQLISGLQVDLRVVKESSYGAALTYFTGSKPHNIALRQLALKHKLKVNEYGVYRNNRKIAGKTEEDVYHSLKLPYLEPELRENRGEIAAAMAKQLPQLIRIQDIRGDLHCHTNATDGRNTLETMAKTAISLGYEYLAITDHTQHLAMVSGQDSKRVLAQIAAIDKLNEKLTKKFPGFLLLKSAEVDILENGRLDLPNKVLKNLDLCVCSIHSKFNLSAQKQTERMLRAMDNSYFTIWGHPSGRLINHRPPYEINFETIFTAAKARQCIMELNAQPNRLDLNDELCRLAKEMGLKIAISTDAHSYDQLRFMQFGINQARRGWLEPNNVINTQPLSSLLQTFKKIRK